MISAFEGRKISLLTTKETKMSTTPPTQHRLAIIYQSTNTLNPRSTNPRTHSKKQINQIAKAIQRFGFTNPILIDTATVSLRAMAGWRPPKALAWIRFLRCASLQ